MSGLNGIVYNFEKNATDNGKFRPENSCFCKEGNCMPPGLLDVHDCYYGFPIATSFPHFLDADPSVREHVEGSRPDPKKHRSYFTVQPVSFMCFFRSRDEKLIYFVWTKRNPVCLWKWLRGSK